MPSYKRSRYPAVNERRRKKEWNARSTAQLGRYRRERQEDLRLAWSPERRGKRARHGLVNTGYLASLMADRNAVLAEARGEVPVREAHHADGSFKATEHTRTLRLGPAMREIPIERREAELLVEPTEDGKWLAHLPDGSTRTFAYKSEAEGAARSLI